MSDSVRPRRQQPTRLPRPWDSPGKYTGVGCHFPLQCMKVKSESEVVQSCPALSNPMDCSPPGFFVHGIFQARVLEWGAIAFSQNRLLEIYICLGQYMHLHAYIHIHTDTQTHIYERYISHLQVCIRNKYIHIYLIIHYIYICVSVICAKSYLLTAG